jgi:hypothetical protein
VVDTKKAGDRTAGVEVDHDARTKQGMLAMPPDTAVSITAQEPVTLVAAAYDCHVTGCAEVMHFWSRSVETIQCQHVGQRDGICWTFLRSTGVTPLYS